KCVDGEAFQPVRVKDQNCVVDVLVGDDLEARLVKIPAAHTRRRLDSERRNRRTSRGGAGALPKEVQQAKYWRDQKQDEQNSPNPNLAGAALQTTMMAEFD